MTKERYIRRLLVAIPAALLGFGVLCLIFLHSNAFRNFLRSEIRKQAMQQGVPVDIGGLEIHWTRLGLALDDIVVHGKENAASGQPPLFSAKRFSVSVLFLPLLRGRIHLRELILERPVVHLRIDAQGNSNLLIVNKSGAHDTTSQLFDLEAQNCAIRDGEVFYNDVQLPLDAELHGMKFHAGYSILIGKYTGSLSYENGLLTTAQTRPVAHAMQLRFAADRSGLSLSPLSLTISGDSQLILEARIRNYEKPRIEANYRANLLLDDISRVLRLEAMPRGRMTFEGRLGFDSSAQGPYVTALALQGHAHSGRLELRTGSPQPWDLSNVSAAYELKGGNLRVTDFSAAVLGGQARGSWEMRGINLPNSTERLTASLRGVSLGRASDGLAPPEMQRIPIAGSADADVRVSWTGSLDSAVAHLRLAISSPQETANSGSVIPLSGSVEALYNGPRNVVSFDRSYLQTRNTKLRIAGALSPAQSANSNVSVLLTASDLHEISSLATLIGNASPQRESTSIPQLGGSANFHGTITGSAKNPRIQGQLAAQNLIVNGSRWESFSLNLQAQPSEVRIQNAALFGSHAQITFDGSARLQNWALAANSPISLHAKATNLALQDAEEMADLHYPVSGTVVATISIKGTKQNPEANGLLTLTHGSAWNEPIDKLTLDAKSNQGTIHSTVVVQVPAGNISADSSFKPATQEYALRAHGNGLQLAKVATLERFSTVGGAVDVRVAGSGTIHNPSLQASLAAPQLQVRDQDISNVAAQIRLADNCASLTLHSRVYAGSVEAKGDVNLTGSRTASASVDVRALPIATVAAALLPIQDSKVSGQTEIHLSFQGPLDTPAQMQAHLEIPTFNLAYDKAQLALAQPLRADYRNGEVTLASTRIQGTGTNLTFGGTIPIRNAAAAGYSLSADGSIDLNVLQQFAPNVRSSGQVLLHVRSQGTSAAGVHGQLQLKNAVVSTESSPIGIEGLNAQINLSGTRADIANFSGTAGGGSISARGFFAYDHEPNFNVALDAKSVRIRYPEGLRSVLSGQLNVQGTPASSTLTGRVLVDRLSFTQAFDLANFAGSFSQDSGAGPASLFERGMHLNVSLQSSQNLNLTSSKVSVGGSANLMVKGTLTDPVLLGRVGLTSGEVFFLGKRFEVQNGTIAFVNAARTEPVLNMRVTTTVKQYNVTLNMSGPVERLKTNYTSDPALPQADIIHLLAFGTTTEEAAAAPSQSAGASAESVLAQGVSSQVAGKVENLTGISQLTIDPLAANSQGNPGAQVAIQQRVTGSILLTFSTDVTSTQSETVQLQYRPSKRWSVTVLRDQNGGYGIDLRLHKEF